MKTSDIQTGRVYPSRIAGEWDFEVTNMTFATGRKLITPIGVSFVRLMMLGDGLATDAVVRVVTPEDFIAMARLPHELPHVPPILPEPVLQAAAAALGMSVDDLANAVATVARKAKELTP